MEREAVAADSDGIMKISFAADPALSGDMKFARVGFRETVDIAGSGTDADPDAAVGGIMNGSTDTGFRDGSVTVSTRFHGSRDDDSSSGDVSSENSGSPIGDADSPGVESSVNAICSVRNTSA